MNAATGPGVAVDDLAGKVVVVTGAGGLAGPPLVTELARRGARVVAAGRSEEAMHQLATSIDAQHVVGAGIDLSDAAATQDWAGAVLAEHTRVDGVFHLVGGWRGGAGVVEADPADFVWLAERLVGTLQHTTRAFHDPLVASGGRLAIVSTVQVAAPSATNAAYAAAKAAAEAWVLAVADSFRRADSDAAASVVRIKALVTDEMRAARPDRKFPGYTHVDDLAARLADLWATPADQLNSRIESLVS